MQQVAKKYKPVMKHCLAPIPSFMLVFRSIPNKKNRLRVLRLSALRFGRRFICALATRWICGDDKYSCLVWAAAGFENRQLHDIIHCDNTHKHETYARRVKIAV